MTSFYNKNRAHVCVLCSGATPSNAQVFLLLLHQALLGSRHGARVEPRSGTFRANPDSACYIVPAPKIKGIFKYMKTKEKDTPKLKEK